MVEFDYLKDPELGLLPVPNRLWQVPAPLCFSRVHVLPFRSYAGKEVWDLSDPEQRIEFYETVMCHGTDEMLLEGVRRVRVATSEPVAGTLISRSPVEQQSRDATDQKCGGNADRRPQKPLPEIGNH